MSLNRRNVLKSALAAGAAASALKVPAAVAQPGPIKVGFLTIKTGPLASGGLQMEQGLVERFGVQVLIGPLAAFEALAIDDYIKSSKTPILTVAGAEDMTQRKAN